MIKATLGRTLWLMVLLSAIANAEKTLLTTIKPLALIAGSALDDNDQWHIEHLFPAALPAHELPLKASYLRRLAAADLVIWVGPELEGAVGKAIAQLPAEKVIQVDLLPLQWPTVAENDQHVDEEDTLDHHHTLDPHIWLNPDNANRVAAEIQRRLSLPERPLIDAEQLTTLEQRLSQYGDKRYFFQHDGYGHFTSRFGLDSGHALRSGSGVEKGVKTRFQLQTSAADVACLFYEPQYDREKVASIAQQINLPLYVLDPQGIDIEVDRRGYQNFVTAFVDSFIDCFQ